MTALWIANVHVTDPDGYDQYARLAAGAIESHGGVYLARGGHHVQLEGRDRARNVVVRFPSVEAAVTCYNSDGYQQALAFARDASVRDVVVVEEIER